MPPSSSSNGVPISTSNALSALTAFALDCSTEPFIFANAASTAPAALPIEPSEPAKASACEPVSVITADKPCTSPNRIAILSALPPVAFCTSSSAPARPLLFSAFASNSMPSSLASFLACSLGLIMLLNALRSASIAVDGCIPAAVSVAMPAPTSSSDTPAVAAMGVMFARLADRSVISILPSLMIWNSLSETSPAALVLNP